jgi:hypothetical protein
LGPGRTFSQFAIGGELAAQSEAVALGFDALFFYGGYRALGSAYQDKKRVGPPAYRVVVRALIWRKPGQLQNDPEEWVAQPKMRKARSIFNRYQE